MKTYEELYADALESLRKLNDEILYNINPSALKIELTSDMIQQGTNMKYIHLGEYEWNGEYVNMLLPSKLLRFKCDKTNINESDLPTFIVEDLDIVDMSRRAKTSNEDIANRVAIICDITIIPSPQKILECIKDLISLDKCTYIPINFILRTKQALPMITILTSHIKTRIDYGTCYLKHNTLIVTEDTLQEVISQKGIPQEMFPDRTFIKRIGEYTFWTYNYYSNIHCKYVEFPIEVKIFIAFMFAKYLTDQSRNANRMFGKISNQKNLPDHSSMEGVSNYEVMEFEHVKFERYNLWSDEETGYDTYHLYYAPKYYPPYSIAKRPTLKPVTCEIFHGECQSTLPYYMSVNYLDLMWDVFEDYQYNDQIDNN